MAADVVTEVLPEPCLGSIQHALRGLDIDPYETAGPQAVLDRQTRIWFSKTLCARNPYKLPLNAHLKLISLYPQMSGSQ